MFSHNPLARAGAIGLAVGAIAQLDLYLDDLLPDSLGAPIFVGSR